MRIGTVDIEKEVLVIAEIGNNHEGSFEAAVKMLHAAADAGVHAVKFQTYKTELYANPHHDEARFKRLKRFELTQDQFKKLKDTADTRGVMFLSTPFDLESAEFLNELVPAFKIGSGENTFYPLLEKIASFCKPIIMSCGISEVSSIRAAKTAIEAVWKRHNYTGELALLHCVSAYPTKPEEANLLAIKRLQREFGDVVGYSDHTLGIEAAVVSLGLGARIVEKHFTLDKNYSDFRDHQM